MNPLWLLGILATGCLWSLLLAGAPRIALLGGLSAIGLAGLAGAVAAVHVLSGAPGQTMAYPWPLPLGTVSLAVDGLSAWFLLVIGPASAGVAVYSWGYLRAENRRPRVALFSALLCVLVAAMVLAVCAADAVSFLLGWELMSLAAFFLVGFHDLAGDVRRGAWLYLVATHLGTALGVVPLFSVLVARSHSMEFAAFAPALSQAGATVSGVALVLGVIGFGTKAGLVPLHVWLPAAHPVAPSPVSALLSGVVVKIGIYGLLRLLSWLPPLPTGWGWLVLAVGMVSGVLGVLYALAQHDLKRLLAYSTVENVGIIALGIGVGLLGQGTGRPALVALGYGGALLHVLNHALFKGLLFLSAGAVIHSSGTGEIDRLGGLGRRTPVNALLFLLGAVAICDLPPLNGFVSEWLIYGALFGGTVQSPGFSGVGIAVGLVALALMGGLALACFAKVYSVVFLGEPRDATLYAHGTPFAMRAGMVWLAVWCIAIGVLPGFFVPLTARGVACVTRLPVPAFAPSVEGGLAPAATLTLLAAVFLALVVALASGRRIARRGRAAVEAASPGPAAVATWACGYSAVSPRMQYTASSFAWPLLCGFRGLLWSHREFAAPAGSFPRRSELRTHTADVAEHDVFGPLFRAVARLFAMIRTVSWSGEIPIAAAPEAAPQRRVGPIRALLSALVAALRRGSIQVYLAFMVLALVIFFLVEALAAPGVGAAGHALPEIGG